MGPTAIDIQRDSVTMLCHLRACLVESGKVLSVQIHSFMIDLGSDTPAPVFLEGRDSVSGLRYVDPPWCNLSCSSKETESKNDTGAEMRKHQGECWLLRATSALTSSHHLHCPFRYVTVTSFADIASLCEPVSSQWTSCRSNHVAYRRI